MLLKLFSHKKKQDFFVKKIVNSEFRICENKLITIISNLLGSFWAVKKRRRLLY